MRIFQPPSHRDHHGAAGSAKAGAASKGTPLGRFWIQPFIQGRIIPLTIIDHHWYELLVHITWVPLLLRWACAYSLFRGMLLRTLSWPRLSKCRRSLFCLYQWHRHECGMMIPVCEHILAGHIICMSSNATTLHCFHAMKVRKNSGVKLTNVSGGRAKTSRYDFMLSCPLPIWIHILNGLTESWQEILICDCKTHAWAHSFP